MDGDVAERMISPAPSDCTAAESLEGFEDMVSVEHVINVSKRDCARAIDCLNDLDSG